MLTAEEADFLDQANQAKQDRDSPALSFDEQMACVAASTAQREDRRGSSGGGGGGGGGRSSLDRKR